MRTRRNRFHSRVLSVLAVTLLSACGGNADFVRANLAGPPSGSAAQTTAEPSYLLSLAPGGEAREFLVQNDASLTLKSILPLSLPDLADFGLSPSNHLVFALQKNGNLRVLSFDRNDGTAREVDTKPTTTPRNGECGLVVDPTGRFVVVILKTAQAPDGSSTFAHFFFNIDQTTGALTASTSNPPSLRAYSYETLPSAFDNHGHLYYRTMDYTTPNAFSLSMGGYGVNNNGDVTQVADGVPIPPSPSLFDASGSPLVSPLGMDARNGCLYFPSGASVTRLIPAFRNTLHIFQIEDSGTLKTSPGSPLQDFRFGPGPGVFSPSGRFGVDSSNIEPFDDLEANVGGLRVHVTDSPSGLPSRLGSGVRFNGAPRPQFFLNDEILIGFGKDAVQSYRVNSKNGDITLHSSVDLTLPDEDSALAASNPGAIFLSIGSSLRSLQLTADGRLLLLPEGVVQAQNSRFLTIPELSNNPQRGHGLSVYGHPTI